MPWMPLGWVGASGVATTPPAYELISTQVLSTTSTGISFSSLSTYASTYKHLQLRVVVRSGTATGAAGDMRFNSDSATNYRSHSLLGDGTSVSSGDSTNSGVGGQALVDFVDFSPNTSNGWTVTTIDILDAFSTSKNKVARQLGGRHADGVGIYQVYLRSGVWFSTAAITDISLYPRTQSFGSGSRFSLYGVRG
jgi:hypothetical protein